MRRVTFRTTLFAAVVLTTLVAGSARADSVPSEIAFMVCPNVTQTIYPDLAGGPRDLRSWTSQLGCGQEVRSANYVDGACMTRTNTDLGTFRATQNPLGVAVQASAQPNCATSPPTLGAGIGNGALTLTVARRGFCSTTLTIPARTGSASVIFPVGNLPLGSYDVTLTLPDQTMIKPNGQPNVLIGTQASGTLHVGAPFTETDTESLVGAGKTKTFAVVLRNSVAGRGAGEFVATKTGNPSISNVTGTEYYTCGTIKVAATMRYGKRGANGAVRLTGDGSLTGGTGNYKDIKGTFTITGSYSTKTNRGTFTLKGAATY